ncbi:hypothetical protein [Siphonobacter aquaeclarae]|uniref:Small multi-drug export protein n=1 Tax=Siphonobacter aquaeclarae TaxID=563176 RepID=A0A1G9WUC9_9BACT|nr:hypothetical protein [Siphonobacter aquaeclarae]SDM87881.1 hypothetical protein SAMN04488090_4434 [Siphonobacter aquaeclarae]
MNPVSKYISVALASMLKFVAGPLAGLALELTWWESAACTVAGMMMSVLLFTFLGRQIRRWWEQFRKTRPRLFSPRTRRAVRVYRAFGIAGIACLTPLLFTPIGGTLLAVSFKASPQRILLWMMVFGVVWGIVLTLAIYHVPGLRGLLGKS